MASNFERHFLGFLVNFACLLIIQALIVWAGWSISLAIPFGVLSFTVYRWSGFRGALFSAILITSFSVYHWDRYGWNGFIQIVIGAFGIAGFSGITKRALIRAALEADHLRRLAVDTYNGNRKKAMEGLESLDKALAATDIVEVKRLATVARIKWADTLTLTGSWHEMARDKEIAIERLDKGKVDGD